MKPGTSAAGIAGAFLILVLAFCCGSLLRRRNRSV